jgi:hypothetical protein
VASGGAFHGQGNNAGTYALAHLLSILPTILHQQRLLDFPSLCKVFRVLTKSGIFFE